MDEPAIYQQWRTKHDGNGNPRRVWVVWTAEGKFYDAIDEGYAGKPEPLKGLVDLGQVDVSIGEYNRVLKRSPSHGRFFGAA